MSQVLKIIHIPCCERVLSISLSRLKLANSSAKEDAIYVYIPSCQAHERRVHVPMGSDIVFWLTESRPVYCLK